MMKGILAMLGLISWIIICTGCAPRPTLTDQERAKLDHDLQQLLAAAQPSDGLYTVRARPDGEKTYGVLIRSSDPEALREAGLPVGSVVNDVVTAYMTVEELRKAVALPSVRWIENPPRHELNQ